jgi:hypothetical protein
MTDLFAGLESDKTIENETDYVASSVLESGLYDFTIDMAFMTVADSGAKCLNLRLKHGNDQDFRQNLYVTSGTKKGCKNFFTDKNGKNRYLPGFNIANALCLLTVKTEIGKQTATEKVINLWNKELKKETPTPVQMITALTGQKFIGGVVKQTVDKTTKDAATAKYVPTGETRDENDMDKIFRASDGLTVAEIRAKVTESVYKGTWAKTNTDVTRNRAKGAAAPGSPAAAAGANTGAVAGGAPGAAPVVEAVVEADLFGE